MSWENLFIPYPNNKVPDQPVHQSYSRNFKTLASLISWAGWFESYLVANPEDSLSCDEAHIKPSPTGRSKEIGQTREKLLFGLRCLPHFLGNILPGNYCCKWNCAAIYQKPFFLTGNIHHKAENHLSLTFYWFKNEVGILQCKTFWHQVACVPASLNIIDDMTEIKRQNCAI